MFVFDMITDLHNAEKEYATLQNTLADYNDALKEYDKVNTEYNKYSYSYLSVQEKLQDRMEVLEVLEATILAKSTVQSITISENVISISLAGVDLEETSALAKDLESYEIVDHVTVNTASYGGTYTTRMVITLTSETNTTGGAQ